MSGAPPVEASPARRRVLTVGLVALVLAAGAALWLVVRHADRDPVAPNGELSSSAARHQLTVRAEKLTETAMSYRAARADQDIAEAERQMTPRMRAKYERTLPTRAERPQQAARKVTVRADVVSLSGQESCARNDCAIAIVSASEHRARVLVFVDQRTAAANTRGRLASRTWELLTLVKLGNRWLIDDMVAG